MHSCIQFYNLINVHYRLETLCLNFCNNSEKLDQGFFFFFSVLIFQMAFELYGMLAGSVSPMTGEHVKPAYGGEEEAFLRKVVTPIYETIAKVLLHLPTRL